MKILFALLLFSSISCAEIFVIDHDKEFPFKAAQIKKSFKKDISDYLDSTMPVLKKQENNPFKLSLLVVGPTVAANVGIGNWNVGGNVGFLLVFARKKDR